MLTSTCRWVASRRLRLLTLVFPTAQTVQEVFNTADSEASLALMAHKLVDVAARMGTVHARAVLRAWLQHLVAAHMRSEGAAKPTSPQEVHPEICGIMSHGQSMIMMMLVLASTSLKHLMRWYASSAAILKTVGRQ